MPDFVLDVAAAVSPRPGRAADDAAWVHQTFGLAGEAACAVADGVGAGGAGHLAAAVALASLAERFASFLPTYDAYRPEGPGDERLEAGFALANRRLFDRGERDPRWRGLSASAVAARFAPGAWRVVHVGTCRAYLLRAGALVRLTDDHSLGRELGDDAPAGLDDVVTRALGPNATVRPSVRDGAPLAGDRYLLCSFALAALVGEGDLARLLGRPGATARALCGELTAAAASRREARGGGADATAAVVCVESA
ncbi:MAG TPA: protein phosphatase 2C domain-containing protein [Polyangiaceae bacterium]|nr:protein phosphatase 2C domain-containing protein [Polyangiaceae bacterium]